MPRLKLNTLKHPKVRQNWNKRNVYNIHRLPPFSNERKSFFQQKYAAKSDTRAYHGEHLTERKWNDMFVRNLKGVMPMDITKLGTSDGSAAAMGRGSGLDELDIDRYKSQNQDEYTDQFFSKLERIESEQSIPFMNGLYAPMERRLDTAIFRAMFASSVRQARNFVVHGRVHVNGKRMRHPGYMLNPGDMFSVDPELVLFATGAPKPSKAEAKIVRDDLRKQFLEEQKTKAARGALPPRHERAEAAKKAIEEEIKADAKLNATVSDTSQSTADTTTTTTPTEDDAKTSTDTPDADTDTVKATEEAEAAEDAIKEPIYDDGRVDETKPYATPWRPRDFLNVFAFVPRYLEVNHNICHAVYLRHPVARPGECEVPTPFNEDTMQLAHAWYLRRR